MNKVLVLIFIIIVGTFIFIFAYSQRPMEEDTSSQTLTLPYSNQNANQTTGQDINQQSQQEEVSLQPDQITTQPTPEATVDPETLPKKATLETSKGTVTIELYPDVAPKTVKNFADKAKSGYYEGLTFHRVEDWVVQGGDPSGNGTGGGNMPTEFNKKPFLAGSLGVARRNDPTVQNDSQFFFTKSESSWLNEQYTNFGIITEGLDIINKMEIGDKIVKITLE